MAGSIFGKIFKISTWGESHGKAVGVTIDGCPSGVKLDEDLIYDFLKKRRPNKNFASTSRNEKDIPEILSGVFNGITTGSPISVLVRNNDSNSSDYDNLKEVYRPSHADFTYLQKYHIRDHRGGGRASGRETVARVIAGAVAKSFLSELDISVSSYVYKIGNLEVTNFDFNEKNDLNIPDKNIYNKVKDFLSDIKSCGDSIGGSTYTLIRNLPSGLGEPVFDKLESRLSSAILSIGGVKSVEFGLGVSSSEMRGSEFNDIFISDNSKITTKTNNSGGMLGGISNGNTVYFKSHFKPTPSIGISQHTVNISGESIDVTISGRHDPTIVVRGNIVIEAMSYVTIADLVLENMCCSLNNILTVYKK